MNRSLPQRLQHKIGMSGSRTLMAFAVADPCSFRVKSMGAVLPRRYVEEPTNLGVELSSRQRLSRSCPGTTSLRSEVLLCDWSGFMRRSWLLSHA
jgi:hypothetical protein